MKRIHFTVFAAAVALSAANAQEEHEHHDHSVLEELNPSVSLVVDALFYHENSEEGLSHIKEEMPGFGHAHGEDDHGHGQQNGFNLREVEVHLSGEVDGYFSASSTFSFSEDHAEVETAEIETTSMPWGLSAKAGKFFSGFGIINSQHPHQWDFSDQPLIYELALGDHGLNDIGVQATWQAPLPFSLQVGAEALQGDNEALFAYEGDGELPQHNGPRLGVAWLKGGPNLGHRHNLEFGVFGAGGIHQEIHEESAGTNNYLDGNSYFAGADTQYRYNAHGDRGKGDLTFQAEYFRRSKHLDLTASDDPGTPIGGQLDSDQDGYYVQALYGFLPRWRGGFRWEQVGLVNDVQEPDSPLESFGDSWRASAMVDFSPSVNSRIRLQASNGDYTTEEGPQNVWEGYVQLLVTLGTHRHSDGHDCGGH